MSMVWRAEDTAGEAWWRAPDFWRQIGYHAALPALVAWLPVLWPLPALKAAGATATAKPIWAVGPLFAVLGLLWARQVMAAVADDLSRRLESEQVDERLADLFLRWVYPAIVILAVVIPLRYDAILASRERAVFRRTSAAALEGIAAAVQERGQAWAAANPAGKAFAPDDARVAESAFGGPFAAGEAGAIAKMVHDDDGRWWYIHDRPVTPGRSLKAWIKGMAGQHAEADERHGWINERGLVWVPAGTRTPRTTVWGMPLRQLVPLGSRWHWYHGGEPAELDD